MTSIRLDKVEKWYGDLQVIKGIDLQIEHGEFVVFVGPSGCGKSTLLRMIAGLEETSRGHILLEENDVTDKVPAERGLAMVFQSYALYPHMTVRENMGFGLKTAGVARDVIDGKVNEAAAILQLEPMLERRPKALSGGQRQRVAIGRCIVREPKAFLFDEPLSNLDAALRVDMRLEIAKLHEKFNATMIYVTHDQVEAMTMADKIVVLRAGQIMQVGTPRVLYEKPANLFVAQFIGSPKMNLVPCKLGKERFEIAGHAGGEHGLANPVEGDANLGIRPEHIELVGPDEGNCKGSLAVAEYLGSDTFAYLDCPGIGVVTVRTDDAGLAGKGKEIGLRFARANMHIFDSQEQRLS